MQNNGSFKNYGRTSVMALAFAALLTMIPTGAKAACGLSPGTGTNVGVPPQIAVEGQTLQSKNARSEPDVTSDPQLSIVGLWFVEFTPDGAPSYQGFDVWHSDGTEILNDNSVVPAAGNVCVGVWKRTDDGTIQLKHPGWNFDRDGILHGTVALLETITLDPGGSSYGGLFRLKEFDLMGNQTGDSTGHLRAHRITVD